jgi:hypothetical protein
MLANARLHFDRKVQSEQLPIIDKLPSDKRIIPITIKIPFDGFCLQDRFDWDIDTTTISPFEFAQKLCPD